jgi:Spy/CpxP family protein refolding chaperone
MGKLLLSSIVALALVSPTLFAADEPATKSTAKKAAADKADAAEGALKGQLPSGYAKIVDATQRQKIYAIQTQYAKDIDDLKKKLVDLEAKRDAEIRAVLTEKQQKELDASLGDTKAVKGKKMAKE